MRWADFAYLSFIGLAFAGLAQAQTDTVEDNQPKPIFAAPPVFPMGAHLSGSCDAIFDLNTEGEPENIQILQCTDNLFEWSATAAIRKFRFKKEDGGTKGLKQRLAYNLMNEFGQKLPVPDPVVSGVVPDEPAKIKTYGLTKKPRRNMKSNTPWCCFEYSVSDTGTPFNVVAKKCSSDIDEEIFGTGFDIREWVYAAALKDNNAISTDGYYEMLWYYNNGQRVYRGSPEHIAQYCPILSKSLMYKN